MSFPRRVITVIAAAGNHVIPAETFFVIPAEAGIQSI